MKKMILNIALSAVMMSASAQVTEQRTATLVETDGTQVFYGANAAVNAYAAAKDGATIILSEGEFNGVTIKDKTVKIYGAGMDDDEAGESLKTQLRSVRVEAEKYYDDSGKEYWAYPKNIHLEGLKFSSISVYSQTESPDIAIEGMTITKCSGTNGSTSLSFQSKTSELVVSQCFLCGITLYKQSNDAIFRNCYIYNGFNSQSNDFKSGITVDHCIMNSGAESIIAYYTNNIFLSTYSGVIGADATAYNNIFVGKSGLSSNATGDNNWFGIEPKGIFAEEGEDGSYAPGKKFTLKYPQTYVGTDGTEVGINGGVTPWNPISSIPRIISSKIDNRADSDGKINVSIKVEAQNRP